MKSGATAGAFLHQNKLPDETPASGPPRWRAALYRSASAMVPRRPLQLAPIDPSSPMVLPADAALRFDAILPGMLVTAQISGVLADGLRLIFCGYFEGTVRGMEGWVRDYYMNTLTSEWGKKFKLGSRVTARILWVVPEEKRVALALVPHLISLTPFAPPSSLAVGSSHNCAVGLTVRGGAILTLASDISAAGPGGFASQLKDLQKGQVAADELKKLRTGHAMEVVVTAFRWLDGLLEVSARPSTKAQQHLGYDEIHAGDVLPATVLHVDPAGAKLRVGGRGGVVGKCRVEHMTEQAVAKPHTKLTKGQAVECLVIECEPARAKLLLSIKPSLVASTLPRLLSYELAEEGMETHGVVARVGPRSLLLQFLNGVRGIVLGSELQASLGAIWETVRC
ncbi:MAG: hypothetical protein SGPRY_002376 [Prymnesium sp.]